MKVAEGMKRIEEGWVIKAKGFRVRFQQVKKGELITSYSPAVQDKPLDSDVTAWRYAWKLAMATKPTGSVLEEVNIVNVTVVDDKCTPVVYYVTGNVEIFNRYV